MALRVGANRVYRTEGPFHQPFGDQNKSQEEEIIWRRCQVKKALNTLTTNVDKPTLFIFD
ncbi:MAG: hypothetical protein AAGU27_23935 [Dehalobacterium sp.]